MNKETLYCGIDLHKNFSMVCKMDKEGRILEEKRLQNRGGQFEEYFRNRGSMECVVEPVDNWGWVTDRLQEMGHKVHLANTYEVRLIAESRMKTDRVDARILADLLRTGFLPEGYVASVETRDRRTYLRYRISLVRERARIKNQIKKLFRMENIEEPPCSDLFGKKGLKWMGETSLRAVNNRLKIEKLATIGYYDNLIKNLDSEIRLDSKSDESVQYLMTVPGIGHITAHMIMSEAADMNRFKSARHFAGYTGLVPSQRSSADRVRHGHITKQGNKHLRWLLVEAAHKAKVSDINLKLFFDRIAYKKGKGAANVALARKLAEICWHVVIDKVTYDTTKVCRRFG